MLEYPKAMALVPTKNAPDETMDNKQATPVDLAYLAGVIDGEGCIAIQKQRFPNRTGYAVNVKVTNTDANIIERVQAIMLGIGINPLLRERETQGNQQWKPWFEVYLTKQSSIKAVLEAVLPYLVGKRARAIIMLRFIDRTIEREEAFGTLRQLNQKGESSETTREAPVLALDEDIVQAV